MVLGFQSVRFSNAATTSLVLKGAFSHNARITNHSAAVIEGSGRNLRVRFNIYLTLVRFKSYGCKIASTFLGMAPCSLLRGWELKLKPPDAAQAEVVGQPADQEGEDGKARKAGDQLAARGFGGAEPLGGEGE